MIANFPFLDLLLSERMLPIYYFIAIPGLALGSSSVSPVGSMSSSSPSSAHFPDDIKDDDWSGDEDDEEGKESFVMWTLCCL